MKKILFIIIAMFYSVGIKAQCVSIEPSIEWSKDTLYKNQGINSDCRPYLKIIYRNNSESDIYFLNLASENYGFPDVRRILLMNPPIKYGENIGNFDDYTNKELFVYMDAYPVYGILWPIIDQKALLLRLIYVNNSKL